MDLRSWIHDYVGKYRGLLWIACSFCLVYVFSLTFVYVEGDDATSIAYHALGRRPGVQPPYAPYQSLMDRILDFLPNSEHLLLVVAMSLTALGAMLFAACIAQFSRLMFPNKPGSTSLCNAIAVTIMCPEIFYFGLVYTPAVIAMSFLLFSHFAARSAFTGATGSSTQSFRLLMSVVLFGIGTAFRWDTVVYGAVIFVDLCRVIVTKGSGTKWSVRHFVAPLGWGVASLGCWLLVVRLCGLHLESVLAALRSSGPVEVFNPVVAAASSQSFATPAFVLFFAIGLTELVRCKSSALLLLVVSLAPALRVLPLGNPKWIISAIPALLATALVGLSTFVIWASGHKHGQKLLLVSGSAILVLPWLVGVQLTFGDTAWGPRFEVRPFDRPQTANQVHIVLNAGTAVPTPEGPRPLGGHAFVLLGGQWRDFVRRAWGDEVGGVNAAMKLRVPLVQDEPGDYSVVQLASEGFTTLDPGRSSFLRRNVDPPDIIERRFVSASGDSLVLLSFGHPAGYVDRIRMLAARPQTSAFVLVAFPGTMRQLYLAAPSAFNVINEVAGVFDVGKAEQVLSSRSTVDAAQAAPRR